jgi:hypothetical protein
MRFRTIPPYTGILPLSEPFWQPFSDPDFQSNFPQTIPNHRIILTLMRPLYNGHRIILE